MHSRVKNVVYRASCTFMFTFAVVPTYLHNFWHVIPQLLLSSYILLTSVYLLVSAALNTVTKYSLLGMPDLGYAEIVESIFVLHELSCL